MVAVAQGHGELVRHLETERRGCAKRIWCAGAGSRPESQVRLAGNEGELASAVVFGNEQRLWRGEARRGGAPAVQDPGEVDVNAAASRQ